MEEGDLGEGLEVQRGGGEKDWLRSRRRAAREEDGGRRGRNGRRWGCGRKRKVRPCSRGGNRLNRGDADIALLGPSQSQTLYTRQARPDSVIMSIVIMVYLGQYKRNDPCG